MHNVLLSLHITCIFYCAESLELGRLGAHTNELVEQLTNLTQLARV